MFAVCPSDFATLYQAGQAHHVNLLHTLLPIVVHNSYLAEAKH